MTARDSTLTKLQQETVSAARRRELAENMTQSTLARKVWLDLDQAQLDAAYDQTVYAPNFAHVIGRMVRNSARMRQRIGDPQVFSYGASPIERLHYYPAKAAGAPIHVHVHGGAWKQRSAEDVAFPAEMFNEAGIGYAVFDFTAVDETNGSLEPMLCQVCAGLAWLAHNTRRLDGNPDRLYVSGFSSGAHLACLALIADWPQSGFAKNPYRAAALVSGLYELQPVRLSKRSAYVNFTDKVVETMSPQRYVEKVDIPILLAHGTCESPEFQRQSRDFAEGLKNAGKPVQYLAAEGYNHYEMMETFGSPYSPLGRALLAQIRQSPQ